MRKFILMVLVLGIASVANAGIIDTIKEKAQINNGIAYSLQDSQINYLGTIKVAGYKSLNLELGYAGRADNTKDKVVAVASINLLTLQNVDMPVLNWLEFSPGAYFGVGNQGETDWGLSATLLKVKF